jgi:hypothetical protein
LHPSKAPKKRKRKETKHPKYKGRKEKKKMRKIVAILLLATMLSSVFVEQAQAVTIKFTSKGKWWQFWKWDLHIEITVEQLLKYLAKRFKIIPKTPATNAFREIAMMAEGWTYETDGETYLSLIAPSPIDTPDQYYVCDFVSVYDDYDQFIWEAYAANGTKVDTGDILYMSSGPGGIVIPVDKFGLLAPYIGLTSTAMIGAVATVVYVRRAKRRKEKQ